MANTRSRPGRGGEVRKSPYVGPDYPEANYWNPWNVGIDEPYGESKGRGDDTFTSPNRYDMGNEKTLAGPTSTPVGMNSLELNSLDDYDSLWEHGTRGTKSTRSKHANSRWTPRGAKGS